MPWLAFIELNYLPHLCPHKLAERSIVYGTVQHPLGKSTHSYSQEAWVFRERSEAFVKNAEILVSLLASAAWSGFPRWQAPAAQ